MLINIIVHMDNNQNAACTKYNGLQSIAGTFQLHVVSKLYSNRVPSKQYEFPQQDMFLHKYWPLILPYMYCSLNSILPQLTALKNQQGLCLLYKPLWVLQLHAIPISIIHGAGSQMLDSFALWLLALTGWSGTPCIAMETPQHTYKPSGMHPRALVNWSSGKLGWGRRTHVSDSLMFFSPCFTSFWNSLIGVIPKLCFSLLASCILTLSTDFRVVISSSSCKRQEEWFNATNAQKQTSLHEWWRKGAWTLASSVLHSSSCWALASGSMAAAPSAPVEDTCWFTWLSYSAEAS